VLRRHWPAAGKAPLAFGGFSGGAKYSGWLAAAFAKQGRAIAGIYIAGINLDVVVPAATQFKVLNADFRRIPIFLQYGDDDIVATPADHRRVYDELMRAGFGNLRMESFHGSHEVNAQPLRRALDWFREFTMLPATF
jgi:predicted esterase